MATPQQLVVQQAPMLRTSTDNIPVLSQVAQAGPGAQMQAPQAGQAAQHAEEELSAPSVWRTNRTHAAAKVHALASNGLDEIEIPAFLRKQAD